MSLGIGTGLHSGFIGEEENRWMKRVFLSNQLDFLNPMQVSSFWSGGAGDDTYSLSYDVYFAGPGYGGSPQGSTSDNVGIVMKLNGNTNMVSVSVPLNTVTSCLQTGTGSVNTNAVIMQIADTGSLPDANDIMYVRDVRIYITGADGTVKADKKWNFEEGGSATAIDGSGTITATSQNGAATITFGENPLS